MAKLNIPQANFAEARKYFDHTPGAIKYSKKNSHLPYSFVKVDNKIYGKGYYLGAGSFGIVKISENEQHENFAIKVEGHAINDLDLSELEILKRVGYYYGYAERKLDQPKYFTTASNTTTTDIKIYKVMKLLEGNDLFEEIYNVKNDVLNHKRTLTDTQKLIIAIKCCQMLIQLHKKGVIHRDIKPENIKVKIAGNDITVAYLDFGLSVILPAGQAIYPKNEVTGTPGYMAPEIYHEKHPSLSKGQASFSSDVFALGTLFQEDLELPDSVHSAMTKLNPHERANLHETIKHLVSLLAKQPDLDHHAHAVMTSANSQRPLPKLPMENRNVEPSTQRPLPVLPSKNNPLKSNVANQFPEKHHEVKKALIHLFEKQQNNAQLPFKPEQVAENPRIVRVNLKRIGVKVF